jgi:hypothetical protein
MTITQELAEAVAELEAYDDEEHRALLDFVRAVLEARDDAGDVVD